MPLLQIEIQATDTAGNIASGMVEVPVNPAPAAAPADAVVTPPVMTTAVDMHADAAAHMTAEAAPAAGVRAQAPQAPRMMEKTIPGFVNESGHGSAIPRFIPPVATQAVRSTTLFKNTGGYR